METAKVQLCRDEDGDYVICPLLNVKPTENGFGWLQRDKRGELRNVNLCPEDFERLFPHLKLKPGDGPRRIEITAQFTD